MASEEGDREQPRPGADDQADGSHEPRECMACRGTGQVISHLGGTTSTVTCPWCDGGAVRLTDADAQARWVNARGETPGADHRSDAGG